MKDQRGFFTVIGLCFLLAVSICVKNIQESQKIYSFSAADFQAEQELQNVADSALIEAAEKIKLDPNLLPKLTNYLGNRASCQYQISVNQPKESPRLGKISVRVYGERGNIHSELGKESDAMISLKNRDGIILLSVASSPSRIYDRKIYRRSLAFVEDDSPEKIYFLNTLK